MYCTQYGPVCVKIASFATIIYEENKLGSGFIKLMSLDSKDLA